MVERVEEMTKDEIQRFLENQKGLGVEETQAFRNLLDIMNINNPYSK